MNARVFAAAALVLTLFRLWLAAAFPFTGDEAYFYWWGKFPDWGFYDHPPMVGWWLAALIPLSEAPLWLRLPQVVLPLLLALCVRSAWPRLFPSLAARRELAALAVLALPVSVWNVFITTDTPLVLFAVCSGLAWARAAQEDDKRWYLFAGLCLAGAVLSKYFAALLGFAYLVDALSRRTKGAAWGLLIVFACTLPALALMAWWNAAHCWSNYLFNFVNRHDAANTGLNATTPLLYVATLAYALAPLLPWLLRRQPMQAGFAAREKPVRDVLARLGWIPLLLFALLSLFKKIGLHWVLAFLPFVALLTIARLPERLLRPLELSLVGLAAAHVLLIVAASQMPVEAWRRFTFYPSLVLTVDGQAIMQEALKDAPLVASDGYSNAATLGYLNRRYVPVLGVGSGHARHDDMLTDWRQMEGRDVVLLRKTEPSPQDIDRYRRWFATVSVSYFEHRGARFWRVIGRSFRYAAYRDDVLDEIRQRYYRVPAWLPMTSCYFCARYFPASPCRR
ncbi:MAG: glycosyltransferase family 39 protein [Rhodocyclaceae bacterium]|nr:glycosyltransferase family 39 protein [Rhodocyclaceae bacterium]